MTDVQTLALAALVWVGCVVAFPVPPLVGIGCAALGFTLRSPHLVLVAGFGLGLAAGAAADAAYRPIGHGRFDGVVDAVSLPRADTFSEQITVRLPSGERVLMSVAPAAGSVRTVHPGMRLRVTGSLRPIEASPWYRSRHLVGRLSAASTQVVGTGPIHWRIAAWLHHTVAEATGSMGASSAALYQGLVTGDDRDQGAAQKAMFRKTGLSHILAVSGQNVAFALVLVHLAVRSLPFYLRPPIVVAALGVFALATQLEPSVLRATFTAGIGYYAVAVGRRASGVRLLAVAVSALLLIDPFMAESLGFQLSVVASGGILLLGPSIAQRLPGPSAVSIPVAVTAAAQSAVSPLLLATFGTVPLVSLPANVLTGWVAGAVMMWGMSGGLVAGIVGGSLEATLQLPVRLLLWWIDGVAVFMAGVPLSPLTAPVSVLCGAVLLASFPLRSRGRLVVAVTVAAALLLGLFTTSGDSGPVHQLEGGGLFVSGDRSHPSVLILDPGADDRVVQGLVDANPGSIDLVVVRGGHRGLSSVIRELARVAEVGTVLAPSHHTVVGASRLLEPVIVESRIGTITIAPESERRLRVELPEPSIEDVGINRSPVPLGVHPPKAFGG